MHAWFRFSGIVGLTLASLATANSFPAKFEQGLDKLKEGLCGSEMGRAFVEALDGFVFSGEVPAGYGLSANGETALFRNPNGDNGTLRLQAYYFSAFNVSTQKPGVEGNIGIAFGCKRDLTKLKGYKVAVGVNKARVHLGLTDEPFNDIAEALIGGTLLSKGATWDALVKQYKEARDRLAKALASLESNPLGRFAVDHLDGIARGSIENGCSESRIAACATFLTRFDEIFKRMEALRGLVDAHSKMSDGHPGKAQTRETIVAQGAHLLSELHSTRFPFTKVIVPLYTGPSGAQNQSDLNVALKDPIPPLSPKLDPEYLKLFQLTRPGWGDPVLDFPANGTPYRPTLFRPTPGGSTGVLLTHPRPMGGRPGNYLLTTDRGWEDDGIIRSNGKLAYSAVPKAGSEGWQQVDLLNKGKRDYAEAMNAAIALVDITRKFFHVKSKTVVDTKDGKPFDPNQTYGADNKGQSYLKGCNIITLPLEAVLEHGVEAIWAGLVAFHAGGKPVLDRLMHGGKGRVDLFPDHAKAAKEFGKKTKELVTKPLPGKELGGEIASYHPIGSTGQVKAPDAWRKFFNALDECAKTPVGAMPSNDDVVARPVPPPGHF